MVKVRRSILPHNVKERLRHQKLQQQLSEIANQVPKPFGLLRETKDSKLRRVILYMKFLHEKKFELLNKQKDQKRSKDIAIKIKETTQQALKFSHPTKFCRKAQIVYLKKPKAAEKNETESISRKWEITKFIKHENDPPETANCHIDTESEISYADSSTLVSEDHFDSYEKFFNKDNDITYIPNGCVSQLLPKEEFSKENKEVDYFNTHLYESILHTPPSSNNSLLEQNMVSNNEIKDMHFERPLMSTESACKFTDLRQFSNSVIKPYAPLRERCEANKYCFPNSQHCHCSSKTMRGPLPSVSVFLPQSSRSLKHDEYSDYFLNQPSYQIDRNLINSKNYLYDNFCDEEQKNISANSKLSPSNQPNSSDLVSSEESIITYFSNEWVSDDTVTDSGSLKESPIKQSSESNEYSIDDENICNMNFTYTKYCNDRANVGKPNKIPTCKSLHSTFSANGPCEKNHNVRPQSMSQLPFVVQKKREKTLNDDGCVPQYTCELSPMDDINKSDTELNSSTSNCDIFAIKLIKSEPDDYLLPADEKSFSLNNFSQWCPSDFYNSLQM